MLCQIVGLEAPLLLQLLACWEPPRALGGTQDAHVDHARRVVNRWEEERVATPNMPITYILPDEGWAPLLEIIVREAPSGSVIEVNTAGMQALAERLLGEVGRQDVTVALRPPRGMAPAQPAGPADRPAERP